MSERAGHELVLAALFGVVAGVGWWRHSVPLALVGVAGLLTAVVLWIWQRSCLQGVRYQATLAQRRATFGEEVAFEIEIVNDKLVPLTWLHVEHRLPNRLTIRGEQVSARTDPWQFLVMVLPMLPYQRARRRVTVVCDRRGEHGFGPAELRSGDPLGYRNRSVRVAVGEQLLVYPKVFALEPPGIASRVLLGNQRTRALLGDPSRVAGVREYRPGDPLRHVDWRATARRTALLVREHEPTASLRVAVFVDPRVPRVAGGRADPDVGEFVVAVAASLVADLSARGVAVGLYSSGTVQGREIVLPPSSSPSALPAALELLARASPYGDTPFAEVLVGEGGRLSRSTSIVVLAAVFPDPTLVALGAMRRRASITTVWAAAPGGAPPPAGLGDAHLSAPYTGDWSSRETLELVP